jgi:hypothetical protein
MTTEKPKRGRRAKVDAAPATPDRSKLDQRQTAEDKTARESGNPIDPRTGAYVGD